MAEIKIPNIRTEGDVRLYVKLSDNGVAVDWRSLSTIRAWLFSEEQQLIAGEGSVSVSPEDGEVLVVDYRVSEAQYLGVQRLVVSGVYDGRVKTYDRLALNFVPTTAMATGQMIIDDPTVSVDIEASEETAGVNIEVSEVSTSMLDAAIEAALGAAVKADESAAAADAAALVATNAAVDARTAADDAREAVKDLPTKEEFEELIEGKQDVLVSGETIKTINGESILGEGNIEIQGKGGFEPTDEQRDAMDSGINADKVSQYDGYASGKQDSIADLATIRSGAAKGATAVQPADLPTVPTKLSELEDDATHRLVTDAEKSKWTGKQDKINDLATIRSGAAGGATSVQTSGDQRIDGQKIFSNLRLAEDTYDETIFFEAGYEADSDLLRLNLNDTYDGESVVLGHVADPVGDFDAVNKQTMEAEIAKVQPGKIYAFAISPEMYDMEFDPTKGVDPYNKSYGYTNITIHEDAGVEWVEGGIYTIMVRENVSNTYRNGRVRIGVNGAWYPLVTVATNQVITASNVLNVNQTTVMVFKKNAFPEGALHCVYVTTYSIATQAEIDAGTSTAARLISPKLMMENYGSKIAALETKTDEIYEDYTTADSLL